MWAYACEERLDDVTQYARHAVSDSKLPLTTIGIPQMDRVGPDFELTAPVALLRSSSVEDFDPGCR
jgi:hypothetical protein